MPLNAFNEIAQLPLPDFRDPDSILASSAVTYSDDDRDKAVQACIDAAFENTSLSMRDLGGTVDYTSYGCPKLVPNQDLRRILKLTQARPFISFTHESDLHAVWMLITSGKSSVLGTGIDYITNQRASTTFEDCTEEELACMFFSEELQNHAAQVDPSAYLGALVSMKESAYKALSQAYSNTSDATPSVDFNFTDLRIEILSNTRTVVQFEAHPRRALTALAKQVPHGRLLGTCTPHANGHMSQAYMVKC